MEGNQRLVPPWPAKITVKQGVNSSGGHSETSKVLSYWFLLMSISASGFVYLKIKFMNACSRAGDKASHEDDLRILVMVLVFTCVNAASRDVANVHMSCMSVAQFTAFVQWRSSEDFHKYDTRNVGPDSASFLMTSLADPGRLPPLASSTEIPLAASADRTLHLR